MGKRIEMDLQEKEYLIRECLSGRMRMREAARRAGVGHSTMHNWISRYRAEGASAKGSRGISVGTGQRHGHRGKIQAPLREPCVGLGKGVSSS